MSSHTGSLSFGQFIQEGAVGLIGKPDAAIATNEVPLVVDSIGNGWAALGIHDIGEHTFVWQ